ncbi:tetratricopeptide repeat protein [Candidatus Latescibacterota bacterium]
MPVVRHNSAIAALVCVAILLPRIAAAQDDELTSAQRSFQQGYALHTGDGVDQDLDRALRYYGEAIRLDPGMYEAHSNAALIYYARKKYRNAEKHYHRAFEIARERDDISALQEAKAASDLGGCYYQEGRVTDAEKWFRFAINRDSSLADAHYNLINLLVADGRTDEARQAISTAERLAPSPRYRVFEGRLRSKESHDDWQPMWLQVTIVVMITSLVIYGLYRRLKAA